MHKKSKKDSALCTKAFFAIAIRKIQRKTIHKKQGTKWLRHFVPCFESLKILVFLKTSFTL